MFERRIVHEILQVKLEKCELQNDTYIENIASKPARTIASFE